MRWSSYAVKALLSTLCLVNSASSEPGTVIDEDGVKSVPLRTHSLTPLADQQPYLDSDLQSRWFDWGGDTIIRADQYIRLTSDRQHQAGWLWSRLPLTATNWQIEWEFKVHGSGNLFGDGMAMWVTKQRAIPGPVFGSADNFEGLGLFVDTYKNNRPGVVFPYISAMLGDGKTSYDQAHDGKGTELAGCSARGIRGSSVPTKAKLTYFQENYLLLEIQYKNVDQWVQCFNVPNVTLPQVAYLGFSAHCGELSDNHEIISVNAKNLYTTNQKTRPDRNYQGSNKKVKNNKTTYQEQNSGGWGWFLFKTVIFFAVVAGGYAGWVAYRTQQSRRSRF